MFKRLGIGAIILVIIVSAFSFGFGNEGSAKKEKDENFKGNNKKVENVIYMIPDGFSTNYAANYRNYKGEEAIWDNNVKGMYTTYSANSDVTDSAAAGTALATGNKTNNGYVGVDPNGKEIQSILEKSQENDKATGLVATSTITHATPASFASHVADRNNETEIARQYADSDVDVFLGGGKSNFLTEAEGGNQKEDNLIEEMQDNGYEFIETRNELNEANVDVEDGEKLLGLFADDAMQPELHRGNTEEPSLAEMTETAIDTLEEDKDGFFLVVEGSQIDWAGHDNDAAYAMTEVEAFEAAVEEAIEFAKEDGKTMVVIASDHETGGMSTGSIGSMDLNADILHDVTATGESMALELNEDRSNTSDVIQTYAGFEPTEEEIAFIQEADDAKMAINKVISDRALIGWTSTNHTGVDMPLYAYGPQSDKLIGFHDNTDLPKILAEAMKLK